MMIPSIDLRGGRAVQLEQGRELKIDAGDPFPIAEGFAPLGEIAVIDLDATLGTGNNEPIIRELVRRHRCRVGGGIRSAEAALRWLDAGAERVILGTAATPEVLSRLPRGRTIAALDGRAGKVVVDGWRRETGAAVIDRMRALRDFVGGFLVTFVEREGMMGGLDLAQAEPLREAAGDARVTVAGGIVDAAEIASLDRMGMDAQLGMALYTGRLDPADAIAALLTSDRPDGLWPTIVADQAGVALGLAYSNIDSLRAAVRERRGVYHSRRRGLWRKGETSGARQTLIRVEADCDRDALRFTVRQEGPFCHLGTRTCFGDDAGLRRLARTLAVPASERDPASYTTRLLRDPTLLAAKIREEAAELTTAPDRESVVHEAADVLFFTLVRLAAAGVPLDEVERELDRRSLKVSRRPGDAKPPTESPA